MREYVAVRFYAPVLIAARRLAARGLRAAIAVVLNHKEEFIEFCKSHVNIYREIAHSDKFESVTARLTKSLHDHVLVEFRNIKFESKSEMYSIMFYFATTYHFSEFSNILRAVA